MTPLYPLDLLAPGFRGLNTEQANGLLDSAWATIASNATIDTYGRLSSRKGYSNVTTTPVGGSPAIKTVFEQIAKDTTRTIICAWNGGIGTGISNPSGSSVAGAVTVTDGNWWFQNFNNKVVGFQNGQKPIVRTTGNFATVVETSGTAPTIADGVGLCAYGRVWGLDSDRQTIKYSGLLDETAWSTGAGSIDMSNVWTAGTDHVTAIVAFNGRFIVFGHRHIVIWSDNTGSQLGINPNNMVVVDVITGTGCESQWSIQSLGEADLMFVSVHGLQSLGRVIQEKSAPVGTYTSPVASAFRLTMTQQTDKKLIRSVVDPVRGLYILTLPTAGTTWVFHMSRPFVSADFKHSTSVGEHEVLFPITQWTLVPNAWCYATGQGVVYLGGSGIVGQYAGSDNDNGTNFTFDYESPYLAVSDELASRWKVMKQIGAVIFTQAQTDVIFRWDFDFKGVFSSKTKTFSSASSAEWGTAQYNISEWSGGVTLRVFKFPAYGEGQYIKIGVRAVVTTAVAIQQIDLLMKIGKTA